MTSLESLKVLGPGALSLLQGLTSKELDKPPGQIIYRLLLDNRAGIRGDLTVARLDEELRSAATVRSTSTGLLISLPCPGEPETSVAIEYSGERMPATAATEPLWDPKTERLPS
jgi:glycine cleavage system aminomethyltransferase T